MPELLQFASEVWVVRMCSLKTACQYTEHHEPPEGVRSLEQLLLRRRRHAITTGSGTVTVVVRRQRHVHVEGHVGHRRRRPVDLVARRVICAVRRVVLRVAVTNTVSGDYDLWEV